MNSNWKENQVVLQVLLGILLCLFLIGVFYLITFRRPIASGLEISNRANSTRTALALTEKVLLGPFATSTRPTSTASNTPTITPSPTVTPTHTPTRTPMRFFLFTATPRTVMPDADLPALPTSTPAPPTSPPLQPTNPPIQPTNPPLPTDPPAPPPTEPAREEPTPCLNPQGHPIPCRRN